MTEKYIQDGNVAILYSPGFGAGWSTWCWDEAVAEQMVFDPKLVQLLLDEADQYTLENYAQQVYPDEYCGGLCDLEIFWLPPGTQFLIYEYDGSESVRIIEPSTGFVA